MKVDSLYGVTTIKPEVMGKIIYFKPSLWDSLKVALDRLWLVFFMLIVAVFCVAVLFVLQLPIFLSQLISAFCGLFLFVYFINRW